MIDLRTKTVIASIFVGTGPRTVCFSPDSSRAWVTTEPGSKASPLSAARESHRKGRRSSDVERQVRSPALATEGQHEAVERKRDQQRQSEQ